MLPAGPGIRVDTGVSEGDTIPADFDSMIAKIIAYGRDREQALGRLRRAMAETTVIIEGGATNKSFVLDLLDQPEVIDASADTGWIDRVRAEGRLVSHRHSAIALAAAAIEAYQDEEEISRQRLLSTAHGGRPQVQHETGRPLDLKLRGVGYRVSVARIGQKRFRVGVSGGGDVHPADVEVERFDAHSGRIVVNGAPLPAGVGHARPDPPGRGRRRHPPDQPRRGRRRALPAPALVVATPLSVGDEVESGAPILVLESMKMETVLRAPFRARVRECPVSVGSQVETGAPLMRLEPLADDGAERGRAGRRGRRDRAAAPSPRRRVRGRAGRARPAGPAQPAARLRRRPAGRPAACCRATWPRGPSSAARPLEGELDLLTVFADLSELSRNKPGGELEVEPGSPVHSPREFFHSYLQSLDVERAGVTEGFQAKLTQGPRALRRHRAGPYAGAGGRGLPDLPGPAADVAPTSRSCRSCCASGWPARRRRVARASAPGSPSSTWSRPPRCASPRCPTWPAAWCSAGSPSRCCAATGPRSTPRSASDLRHLDRNPDAPDRAERIQAMVASAEPLVRLIGQRIGRPGRDHAPLLEVLTRRYYGNRGAVRGHRAGGGRLPVRHRRAHRLAPA